VGCGARFNRVQIKEFFMLVPIIRNVAYGLVFVSGTCKAIELHFKKNPKHDEAVTRFFLRFFKKK
jgi:hypothetical protein